MTDPNNPPEPVEPPTPVVAEEDDFASAFAEMTADPAAPKPAPAADPAPAPSANPDGTPASPAVEVPAGTETPPAGAGTPPVEAPPVSPELAAALAEIEALKSKQTPAPAPAPVVEPPAPAAPPPIYNAEEEEFLKTYDGEWSDVVRGEALKRRGEYQQLVAHIFSEVRKELAPLQEFTQRQGTRTQYQELVELIPAYDDVRPKAIEWVEKLPAGLMRQGYERVLAEGDPKDVAELFTHYKAVSGYKEPAPVAPAPAPAAAPAPVVPPKNSGAVAKAAAALAPVRTSRTEPQQGEDPNDFDGAFKYFATQKD